MRYAQRADLELIFGRLNLDRWADLDGNADTETIEARIENACELAGAEIEDILRHRRYKFPLTPSKTLTDLVAKMAGLHLHDCRGIIDDMSSTDTVSRIRNEVERKIAQIRAGEVYLEGERFESSPRAVADETLTQMRPPSGFDPFKPYFGQRLN